MELEAPSIINEMKSMPIPLPLIDEIKKKKISQYIGKLILKKGFATCFFIKLEKVFIIKNIFQNMNVLMTNHHVIDCYSQDFKSKSKLKIVIDGKEKMIDLTKKRFKHSNPNLDYTIIEILESDYIDNFLKIDESIMTTRYIDQKIYLIQYPEGNSSISYGNVERNLNNGIIYHCCATNPGSSGSPIILKKNHNVIGIHAGGKLKKNAKDEKEFNIGYFMRNILEDIFSLQNIERGEREYVHKLFKKIIRYRYYISIGILLLSFLLIVMFQINDQKIYYPNGKIAYNGKKFFGKRNGKGISYYESGNIEYEGYWKNNIKKGKGKLFDDSESNFLVYEGDFSKNKINGNGTHFYKNGKKRYEGEFINNIYQGLGKYYTEEGILIYNGYFNVGFFNGFGILYYKSGNIKYEGFWQNGKRNTKGIEYYDTKNRIIEYEGNFLDDYYDGIGTLFYESGDLEYKGNIMKNQFHGEGELYYKNGEIHMKGLFENGMLVEGIVNFENGSLYYNGSLEKGVFNKKEDYIMEMEK